VPTSASIQGVMEKKAAQKRGRAASLTCSTPVRYSREAGGERRVHGGDHCCNRKMGEVRATANVFCWKRGRSQISKSHKRKSLEKTTTVRRARGNTGSVLQEKRSSDLKGGETEQNIREKKCPIFSS